jgi:hypothetical protein
MTRQRIRRGVFRSIADLQAAVETYFAEHNASPNRFIWTKSAQAILAKLYHSVPIRLNRCTSCASPGELDTAIARDRFYARRRLRRRF